MTATLKPSNVLAESLGATHRVLKARAEALLAELADAGLVTVEPHLGGSKWTLKAPHAAFTDLLIARHDYYRNAVKARYECLHLAPALILMLGALSRSPGVVANAARVGTL
ncbi:hypothetical protein [Pseudomonas sp. CBZ-4]|jgi:hypothetical protein|uniref:hypothetical protein n=1 Tax=Pseudomonas sp. CBZ-4 TaxID=1163065 RepID=UPI00035E0F58|nr:hypothetical protein [Pseudomonas sp. CBZ-4]